MKEHPILFTDPMVRAILSGTKTQTRRLIKPKLNGDGEFLHAGNVELALKQIAEWRQQGGRWFGLAGYTTLAYADCPYGMPGDRLWVRESGWERPERTARMMREGADTWPRFAYAADGWSDQDRADFKAWGFKSRPSIHMPRWASRILLEITGVRVERLQAISAEDAIAEGVEHDSDGWRDYLMPSTQCCVSPQTSYLTLWESINGPTSWDANPWVWVVEFKRVAP